MTCIVLQRAAHSSDEVLEQLTDAFIRAREAVAEGRPVAFVVSGPGLLGQASLESTLVATGLLGLMRALAFEGVKSGWRANVVALPDGVDFAPQQVLDFLEKSEVSGLVINTDTAAFGRIAP